MPRILVFLENRNYIKNFTKPCFTNILFEIMVNIINYNKILIDTYSMFGKRSETMPLNSLRSSIRNLGTLTSRIARRVISSYNQPNLKTVLFSKRKKDEEHQKR